MAKNKMGKNTKSKILDSAQAIFNQKGFENTSVEEIAQLAGVSKMMVYYHYESKENLMIEIIRSILDSIREELRHKISSEIMTDVKLMKIHYIKMINLWVSNKEIVRFIIINAIKNSSMFAQLQDVLKPFYDELIGISQESSINYENEESYFKLFFFNTLPMIMYSVYRDNYMNICEMDCASLDDIFINSFIQALSNNTEFSKKT